jgi:hypothetical protein
MRLSRKYKSLNKIYLVCIYRKCLSQATETDLVPPAEPDLFLDTVLIKIKEVAKRKPDWFLPLETILGRVFSAILSVQMVPEDVALVII